jgi:predicted Rossmann fold nucleotide-binding protein DprA/Smf involved in DNA uptake
LGIESLAGFRENQPEMVNTSIQKEEKDPIVNLLSNSAMNISTLIQTLNSNESIVMDHLLSLELEGKIVIRGDMVSLL